MEQKSNVLFRAEKEYKRRREGFACLLREIISNSLHAVLIRQSKECEFVPEIELNLAFNDKSEPYQIDLTDNGEGFTAENRSYFEELDKKNLEKEQHHFHPLGQGRLAIVYFCDAAEYETVYKDENGSLKKRTIPYPPDSNQYSLFDFNSFPENQSTQNDSYTKLTVRLTTKPTVERAKTFFLKYPDSESFKQWFIETFFPFIVSNEQLKIRINYDDRHEIIQKNDLESSIETLPVEVLSDDQAAPINALLWLLPKNKRNHGEQKIVCFARNLQAEISEGKTLTYSIDSTEGYSFYLTSDYFDEHVDSIGCKICIDSQIIELINSKINEVLDEKFNQIISANQKSTRKNVEEFKKKFPSLGPFVDEQRMTEGNTVIQEADITKAAIDEKSRIEKKFWTSPLNNEAKDVFDESDECQKLLNSSLQIYVEHRRRVLQRLHDLIKQFDDDGKDKHELESTVHELFFKRGELLKGQVNTNHLHNLWILDERFTIFSNDFKAKSTKQGQALSDIYIWADNPEETNQVLIVELKSTTKAHNAGDSREGMIRQIKRYARDFYDNPQKTLNWNVDTKKIQYTGIILACKADIDKELSSTGNDDFKNIPFLPNSYYKDDKFSLTSKEKQDIRIELYSFEDIYKLAYSRNRVFFDLLQNKFNITDNES